MSTATAPTGVFLGSFTPGTPEWEEARGGLCVTATEIAAVVGLSPWQSRFSLWHKKAGLPSPPFQSNPAMEWGNRLEPAVAQKWAEVNEAAAVSETGTWRHADREWQRATPDRLVCGTDGAWSLLEVKTSPMGDGWEHGLPVYYQTQIQWQLDTLGLTRCHVALLVSGHDYREFTVEYAPDDARLLRDAAQRFLADVRGGVRPPIDDSDATYQTVRHQAAGREDIDVEIPAEVAERYQATGADARAAEAAKRQAAAQVLDLIGTGYRATCDGRRIAYRTTNPDGTTKALQPYTSKEHAA